jgi:DNA-binding transcriptional ArsR family regulator
MPIYEQPAQPTGPAVSVRASVAIELEWVLHSALRRNFRDDHPEIGALYAARPELLDEVGGLWEDPGDNAAFSELVVAAYHGGILFDDDPAALLDRLPDLLSGLPSGGAEFPLESETDADRRVILRRLARLRRSAAARAHYVDVLRRVWEAVSACWDRFGSEAVVDAVAAHRAALAKGSGWRDIAKRSDCESELTDKVVANMGPRGEVVVVPSYFAHCSLLYDLPGFVVIGIRAETTGTEARARNEALARQLRAIADPTRLAIVDSIRHGPKGVTELATRLGLAQPTVSNHVKLLRESGLVTDVREGTRRALVISPGAADLLLQDLVRVLGHPGPKRPGDA